VPVPCVGALAPAVELELVAELVAEQPRLVADPLELALQALDAALGRVGTVAETPVEPEWPPKAA
jgi:hypothetical protein